MRTFQNIIKYCAVAFAIFLAFNIISGITNIMGLIFNVNVNEKEISDSEMQVHSIDNVKEIHSLNVDLSAINFEIIDSDKLNIESNIKDLKIENDSGNLKITNENKHFVNEINSFLKVYIPKNTIFQSVDISLGAGQLKINTLQTSEFCLDVGAGSVNLKNVISKNKTKINTGAGKIEIYDSDFNNVELKVGTGKIKYIGSLSGNSEIDAGIGSVEFMILGSSLNYKFDVHKGLGDVIIDGKTFADNQTYGNGNNNVSLSNAIGSIDVSFYK